MAQHVPMWTQCLHIWCLGSRFNCPATPLSAECDRHRQSAVSYHHGPHSHSILSFLSCCRICLHLLILFFSLRGVVTVLNAVGVSMSGWWTNGRTVLNAVGVSPSVCPPAR
eukprot:scaffold97736_cov64-Phaeocystis_antarctica.AAC.8